MPMEEAVTTVPRCTRPPRLITPVAGLTTRMAVTTRPRAGITHLLHATTSQHRGITTSRGFINRHRVITSRRHEAITGLIRVGVGTAMAGEVGMVVTVATGTTTIAAAMVDAMAGVDGTAMMGVAVTGSLLRNLNKKAAHQAPLFLCPQLNTPTNPPMDADPPRLCGNALPPPHPAHC